MSDDPIIIRNYTVTEPDPVQLDLFQEIVPSPDPPEKVVHTLPPREVEHHIRTPAEIVRLEGESEATITPKLAEVSLKMARALTARSRALSSNSKFFNP